MQRTWIRTWVGDGVGMGVSFAARVWLGRTVSAGLAYLEEREEMRLSRDEEEVPWVVGCD